MNAAVRPDHVDPAQVVGMENAPLAVQEIRIFIEEWLKRIGDFEVDPEVPPVRVTGIVHALTQLGLRWPVPRAAS